MNNPYENARPLDLNLWSDRPEVAALVDAVFDECCALGIKRQHERMKICLMVVLLNLFTCYRADWTRYVRYSRRHVSLIPRYNHFGLSIDQVVKAVERLSLLGYIEGKSGYLDRTAAVPEGRQSRMRATSKLIQRMEEYHISPLMVSHHPEAETILLKDGKKKLTSYADCSETTTRWREEMAVINGIISKTLVNIYLSDAELEYLRIRMAAGDLEDYVDLLDEDAQPEEIVRDPLDFSRKRLVRIFNNSSFTEGGRLYGAWWQSIPRDYRPYVRINRMNTVEVDFGSIHLHLAYWLEDVPVPDGDLYTLDGFPSGTREVVKAMYLTMLNTDVKKAMGSINERINGYKFRKIRGNKKKLIIPAKNRITLPSGITIGEIVDAFRTKHAAIDKWLFLGKGRQLQHWDSVVAVKTLLILASKGVPALPLHDSFIVSEPNEACARSAMIDAFHEVTGRLPRLDTKETLTERNRERGEELMVAHQDRKLDQRGGYSDTMKREYSAYVESFEEWKRVMGRDNVFPYAANRCNREVYEL